MIFRRFVALLLIVCLIIGSTPFPARAGEAWLSSPASGAVVSGKFEISAGFQSSSDKPVTYVVVQINGKEIGTRALSSPSTEGVLSFSWDTTSLKDGMHGIGLLFYSGQQQVAKTYVKVEVKNGSSTITGGSSKLSGNLNKGSARIRLDGVRDGETVSGKRNIHIVPANALGNDLFVSVTANGKLKYLSNRAPYEFALNTEEFADGPLELDVKIKNTNQDQLAAYPVKLNVQNRPSLVDEVRQLAMQPVEIPAPKAEAEANRLAVPPAASVSTQPDNAAASRAPEPRTQPQAKAATNQTAKAPADRAVSVKPAQPKTAVAEKPKPAPAAIQPQPKPQPKVAPKPVVEKPAVATVRKPQIDDSIAKEQAPVIVKAEPEVAVDTVDPVKNPKSNKPDVAISGPPVQSAKTSDAPQLSVKPEINADAEPVKPVEIAKLPEPKLSLVDVALPTETKDTDPETMAAVKKPVATAPPSKPEQSSDTAVSAPLLSDIVPTPAGKPEYLEDSLAAVMPEIDENTNPVTPKAPEAAKPVRIQPVKPVVMAKAGQPAPQPVIKPVSKPVATAPAPKAEQTAAEPSAVAKPAAARKTVPSAKQTAPKPAAQKQSQPKPIVALAPKTEKSPAAKPAPGTMFVPAVKSKIDLVRLSASVNGGRAIVGLRESVQKLGGVVTWDHQNKVVTATLNNRTLRIYTKSQTMSGDSFAKQRVDVGLENGKTVLPARLLEKAWGLDLRWDAKSRTLSVVPFRKAAPPKPEERSV